ncbi:MAG: hypothetical protein ABJE63_11585 [Lentilitoribacter sp.]
MNISKDLLLSILAMDFYNRGYGKTLIGNASFDDDKGDTEAQDAGFYAVTFDTGDKFIISYRSTDKIAQETVAL